jgi:hypothetical protein
LKPSEVFDAGLAYVDPAAGKDRGKSKKVSAETEAARSEELSKRLHAILMFANAEVEEDEYPYQNVPFEMPVYPDNAFSGAFKKKFGQFATTEAFLEDFPRSEDLSNVDFLAKFPSDFLAEASNGGGSKPPPKTAAATKKKETPVPSSNELFSKAFPVSSSAPSISRKPETLSPRNGAGDAKPPAKRKPNGPPLLSKPAVVVVSEDEIENESREDDEESGRSAEEIAAAATVEEEEDEDKKNINAMEEEIERARLEKNGTANFRLSPVYYDEDDDNDMEEEEEEEEDIA